MSRTLPLRGKGNCPRSGAHSRWQIFPEIIHPGDISFPHLGQFIKATPLRKQKNPCLNKETKAISSAVPLFLPDKHVRPLKFCPVTGASGEAYSSSALCSKVMFPGSSRPPCTQTAALCASQRRVLLLFHAVFLICQNILSVFSVAVKGKGFIFLIGEAGVPFCLPKKEPKRHQGASFDEHPACAGVHRRRSLPPLALWAISP